MADSALNGPAPVAVPAARPATPTSVRLYKEDLVQIGFTGRELAAIKQSTGHSLSELLSDETLDDKFIVLAWLKLRREGHDIEWERMQDVVVDFQPTGKPVVDPTNAASSETSPRSVTTGA